MKPRFAARMLIAALGAVLSGCSLTAGEIKGPHAAVLIVEDTPTLAAYHGIALQTVDTDLGPAGSLDMVAELRRALTAEFEQLSRSSTGRGSILWVDATVNYYQQGGGVNAVLGTEARCHLRVKLQDAEDGHVVAELLIPAASTTLLRNKHEHLAQAIAEALAQYLLDRGMAMHSPVAETIDVEETWPPPTAPAE